MPTPLKVVNFQTLLSGYRDYTLCDHIPFGFPINYVREELPLVPHTNHKSALDHPTSVDNYINKLISRGAVIGPLQLNPFNSPFISSSLQTMDKPSSVHRRVVFDLSYPKTGTSANGGIPKDTYLGEPHNLIFPSVDNLIQRVVELGPGCKLMKVDMMSAYKQLYVDPKDYTLLGFSFRGLLFAELTLPFVARNAALCCQRLTNAVAYIHKRLGYRPLVSYILDDFAKEATSERAVAAFKDMYVLQDLLGIELASEKLESPREIMIFLGILINTVMMNVSIPTEKLELAKQELALWQQWFHTSKKQLQSLLGRLCHLETCVRPGRRFLSRIIDALELESFPVRLDKEFHLDILWWMQFVDVYNGVSLIQSGVPCRVVVDTSKADIFTRFILSGLPSSI